MFAFTEDIAASGGYWLACAADEIFADDSSLVGSIGVLFHSFGFHELIARFGIERRLHTSGDKKVILDPFLPQREGDVAHLKALHGDMYEHFKAMVRERRGGRLRGDEAELFSGAFWTGKKALELGLVDGIGDARSVLRERFGAAVRLVSVAAERPWRPWAPGNLGSALLAAVEERLLWSRFGL